MHLKENYILQYLTTLFIGKQFQEFETLPSTNIYATDLLSKSKPPEGTVILTHNQTAGRGQIGSKWESEPDKNVSISIILYPKFLNVQHQFDLNIITALAVAEVVRSFIPQKEKKIKVKWANDIYVGKKKVAGILIQNSLSGNLISSSVIGIGLNVNQLEFNPELPNPTSLSLDAGQTFDLPKVVAQICNVMEQYYLKLKSGNRVLLRAEYLTQLYQIEKVATYQRADGSYFTGILRGITDIGKLIIETEDDVEHFGLKEVHFC